MLKIDIQDVQDRLFQEISDANLDESKLDYNTFMNLEYLDMVVQETMRHNPIVDPQRTCSKEYQVGMTRVKRNDSSLRTRRHF